MKQEPEGAIVSPIQTWAGFEYVKVSDPQGDYMIRRPIRREPEPVYALCEEDDILGKANQALVNVASPLSKPLVDYPSDEENENMETDLFGGILEGADENTPPSSGTAIPNFPSRGDRRQCISDSEEQTGVMTSFRDQVTQVLTDEVFGKPSTLASTTAKSDTPSSSEFLDSRFIHKTSIPSLSHFEETSTDECRLPEGDCRWIFLGVPKTRGRSVTKCACLRYALNPIVSGTTCNCGHPAYYHSSVIETKVEQPKFVARNEIRENPTRLVPVGFLDNEDGTSPRRNRNVGHELAASALNLNAPGADNVMESPQMSTPQPTNDEKMGESAAAIATNKIGDRSKLAQYIRENDFQGLFMPSYLPLLERPSRNERRSSTTEDESETGHLFDGKFSEPAGNLF
jgi:hypothetical protein